MVLEFFADEPDQDEFEVIVSCYHYAVHWIVIYLSWALLKPTSDFVAVLRPHTPRKGSAISTVKPWTKGHDPPVGQSLISVKLWLERNVHKGDQ